MQNASSAEPIGIFEDHGDVGTMLHPSAAKFDESTKTYTISAAGENMWAKVDAFHYAWKKVSGDVSIAADISFVGTSTQPHRKGCLVIRQSLDADSVYADVAAHGDGLTSLQFRDTKGEATHEVQSNLIGPKRVMLEKRGKYVYLSVSGADGKMNLSGAAVRLELSEPFYIGIAVTAHDKDKVETAVFSNVEIAPIAASTARPTLHSTLETITVASTDRRVTYTAADHFEAPNWLKDDSRNGTLIFNGNGHLYRMAPNFMPTAAAPPTPPDTKPELIDTGFANKCNNDHGISPDGKMIAISDQSQERQSVIYTLPITGGTPTRITKNFPSYWHGWSPDGKTLAFCGQRDGQFGIFTIPAAGGDETRLTTADKGKLDDGPEYSPDGKFIYFNSDRSGLMQIYRMKPDGSDVEQMTSDDNNNWFAHVSPDGSKFVFLTYDKSVTGHPGNKDVMLRMMNLTNKNVTVLAKLFGGQGTINVPSWSPDSRRLAFVSYQLVP
jgi:TolB protein